MAKKGKKAKRSQPGVRVIAVAFTIGAGVAAGLFALARRSRSGAGTGGSSAADLSLDQPHHGPGDRANMDFRPDPTAPVPADRRDAMAPATLPNPMTAEPSV